MVLECTTGIYPMGFVPKDLYHWDLYGLFFLNVPHKGFVWICMGLVWLLFGWVKSLPF